MGPGVITPGKLHLPIWGEPGEHASMGPGVITPGKRSLFIRKSDRSRASMGPGVITPGKMTQRHPVGGMHVSLQWGRE